MSRIRSGISSVALLAVTIALLAAASFSNAGAIWAVNWVEFRGTGVANEANEPQITSDGAGGAIVTWEDYRAAGRRSSPSWQQRR